jgi:hypothetical protein
MRQPPVKCGRGLFGDGPRPRRRKSGSRATDIYDARAVAAGVAFCFTAAISVFAAGPEEAGFWPVISKPSLTT